MTAPTQTARSSSRLAGWSDKSQWHNCCWVPCSPFFSVDDPVTRLLSLIVLVCSIGTKNNEFQPRTLQQDLRATYLQWIGSAEDFQRLNSFILRQHNKYQPLAQWELLFFQEESSIYPYMSNGSTGTILLDIIYISTAERSSNDSHQE
mmetsp:Transcript_3436/g.7823  ORF Transcript_3436/g.7823 Transcript_3436/m.7823 type:complete len:148 (+) Transcript_3436:806-1249(+)